MSDDFDTGDKDINWAIAMLIQSIALQTMDLNENSEKVSKEAITRLCSAIRSRLCSCPTTTSVEDSRKT